jgi:hypothetical protein
VSITVEMRGQVRERAGFACEYCGVTETDSAGELAVDHYYPQSLGGEDTLSNMKEADKELVLSTLEQARQRPTWPERKRVLESLPIWTNLVTHEINHAVAILALHYDLQWVSVDPLYLSSKGFTKRPGNCMPGWIRVGAEGNAIIGIASGLADDSGREDDERQIKNSIARIIQTERPDIVEDSTEWKELMMQKRTDLADRTRAMFAHPSITKAVKKACEALIEKGTLTADELKDLIGYDIAAWQAEQNSKAQP